MPRSYCLEVKHSFWLSLSSCSWHVNQLPWCTSDSHCSILHMPCHLLLSFFPFEMGCQNAIKTRKFVCEQLAKVSKIYCFINFPFRWYPGSDKKFEKWAYINPNKLEISKNWIFFFMMIIFVWIFFKDANSFLFSADFLA